MNRIDQLLATRYWGAFILILLNVCGLAAQNVIVSGHLSAPEEDATIAVTVNSPGLPPATYFVPVVNGN